MRKLYFTIKIYTGKCVYRNKMPFWALNELNAGFIGKMVQYDDDVNIYRTWKLFYFSLKFNF